jgi:hypothetical protein
MPLLLSRPLLQPSSTPPAQRARRRSPDSGRYCSPLPCPKYRNRSCCSSAPARSVAAGRQPDTPCSGECGEQCRPTSTVVSVCASVCEARPGSCCLLRCAAHSKLVNLHATYMPIHPTCVWCPDVRACKVNTTCHGQANSRCTASRYQSGGTTQSPGGAGRPVARAQMWPACLADRRLG